MDLSRVRSALDCLIEHHRLSNYDIELEDGIESAILDLRSFLRNPDSDPGDECECDGCKTTEPAPHEEAGDYIHNLAELAEKIKAGIRAAEDRNDFGCLKFDPITDGQPSDYEIRLKAWNLANDCMWETAVDDFAATLDAAQKLYSFLSGQNEDVK